MRHDTLGLNVYQEQGAFNPLRDNSFFFHTHAFVSYNQSLRSYCWTLETSEGEAIGRICFTWQGKVAVSLSRSSFGSFELGENVQEGQLSFFVDQLLHQLETLGFKQVRIVSFPGAYHVSHFNIINKVLCEFGFKVIERHPNHYLPVSNQVFTSLVNADERRYLNRAKKLGFNFRQLDIQFLPQVYKLIYSSRQKKGYTVSMPYEDLEQTILTFPDRYLIFGLFQQSQMIGSSVCVKVNQGILYDFYHGDDLNFRKHSPVVPLLEGIYNYALRENYKLLDLGTSIEEGVYAFKKNLGAKASEKIIFERSI
ncbi:hypothetical protein LVD17_04040 [Fulvivirga ulvae]|uniref:hypothetical protein n=1 Tax=Fulvivirga ulvae TaxID=2904245 RepID=UPI001F22E006|nr:hypothetical protein [Fulvivirga ulvae]UII32998.1 hypothetical protein LVD17_04040 [Fulvivirga ulvae]